MREGGTETRRTECAGLPDSRALIVDLAGDMSGRSHGQYPQLRSLTKQPAERSCGEQNQVARGIQSIEVPAEEPVSQTGRIGPNDDQPSSRLQEPSQSFHELQR